MLKLLWLVFKTYDLEEYNFLRNTGLFFSSNTHTLPFKSSVCYFSIQGGVICLGLRITDSFFVLNANVLIEAVQDIYRFYLCFLRISLMSLPEDTDFSPD